MRIVYSPSDAVKIAAQNPDKQVVFFAVGFETTAPANAMSVYQAKQLGLTNYSILVSHVLVPPAMEVILGSPDNHVQGFLAAGHVCTVMGFEEYEPLAKKYKVPIVVTGFEPLDLLQGIYMCVSQLEEGRYEVENQYARAVRREGNRLAQELMAKVFRVVHRKWRGIGEIPRSGLGLAPEFAEFDAETRFGVSGYTAEEDPECISGLVMQGAKKPEECTAYGKRCTPDHPLGAPMVSSEGACAAYYRYRRLREPELVNVESANVAETKSSSCSVPVPLNDGEHVQLAHGGGGRRMHELLEGLLLPSFSSEQLLERHDGATLQIGGDAPGLHHRLVRSEATVLSGRRHWHAGDQWDRQRPGDVRCASSVFEFRVHPGRRLSDGVAASRRGVDADHGG